MEKNEDVLKLAEKYLDINGTIDKWKYLKTVESKLSKKYFKIFLFWQNDVEKHESHRQSKQTKAWYLKRLVAFMSPEYKQYIK